MNDGKIKQTGNPATGDAAKADATEVAALCETAAQYLMRLKDRAQGRWAQMAIEDLVDAAIDIKAAARRIVDPSAEGEHE